MEGEREGERGFERERERERERLLWLGPKWCANDKQIKKTTIVCFHKVSVCILYNVCTFTHVVWMFVRKTNIHTNIQM